MRRSPIKLQSSKEAKWRASRSKSINRQDASLGRNSNSILDTSNDTVKVNTSPVKLVKSQAVIQQPQLQKSQSVGTYFTKTIRPTNTRSPYKPPQNQFSDSRGFKSLYQLSKSPGIVIQQKKSYSPSNLDQSKSMHSNKSPIKSIHHQNDRNFGKLVQLGRPRQPIKIIHSPPLQPIRVISSPPKVITQVVYKPTPRQIQLQRKVKILQMRIVELHNEKSQIETKLNDMNIRLQYENNFLKEKLNAVPEMRNSQQRLLSNIDHLGKSASSSEQAKDTYDDNNEARDHISISEKGPHVDTPSKPPQHKFSKSSDGFFQKSKQIQSIKQQLLQTQQMLSKQIDKSLKLLQELSLKQKQNQQIKNEVKVLKQKVANGNEKDMKIIQLQEQNKHLFEKLQSLQTHCAAVSGQLASKIASISQLQGKIIQLSSSMPEQNSGDKVPIQMLHQIEQNNQLLLSAINSLQNSVNQSQKQIQQLANQKIILQERNAQLELELQEKGNKLEEKQSGNQVLQEKMDQTENEIRLSRNKVQTFQLLIQEKNELIGEKEKELLQKDLLVQNLQQRIQQLEKTINGISSPTTQPGCRLPERTTCTKCGQLRRTVIRLNSYLNNNSNEFSREAAKAGN